MILCILKLLSHTFLTALVVLSLFEHIYMVIICCIGIYGYTSFLIFWVVDKLFHEDRPVLIVLSITLLSNLLLNRQRNWLLMPERWISHSDSSPSLSPRAKKTPLYSSQSKNIAYHVQPLVIILFVFSLFGVKVVFQMD